MSTYVTKIQKKHTVHIKRNKLDEEWRMFIGDSHYLGEMLLFLNIRYVSNIKYKV